MLCKGRDPGSRALAERAPTRGCWGRSEKLCKGMRSREPGSNSGEGSNMRALADLRCSVKEWDPGSRALAERASTRGSYGGSEMLCKGMRSLSNLARLYNFFFSRNCQHIKTFEKSASYCKAKLGGRTGCRFCYSKHSAYNGWCKNKIKTLSFICAQ
jgi:hypothetical protein